MRIDVFIDVFPPFVLGGAEKRCYEICNRLANKHKINVFTTSLKGRPKKEILENIGIHRSGLPHPLDRRKLLPLPFYIIHSFFQGLHEESDLIWGNGFIGSFVAGVLSLVKNTPLILTLHDVYWDRWSQIVKFPLSLGGKLLEKILSIFPHRKIITVSETVKKELNEILRISKKKIEVIPNGIDLQSIASVKTERNTNQLLSIGRLVPYKHHDHIIKAFAKLKEDYPSLELRIVGSGSKREKLEALTEKLGVKGVHFLGYFPDYKDVIQELKRNTVFVQASKTEGFGIVLLEAMASGCPVVAYDLPVYHQFAEDGKNCLLVAHGVDKLFKGIKTLLEDEMLRKRLRNNGKRTAKEFTWNSIVRRIEKLFQKIVEETS